MFAAIATCFCNDLYREAAKGGVDVEDVKVEVTGTFGGPGEPARDISYRVEVHANASQSAIDELIRVTDSIAEIHNTLRAGCEVRLIKRLILSPGPQPSAFSAEAGGSQVRR